MKLMTMSYAFEPIESWEAFERKIDHLFQQVKQEKPQLVLLPEYAGCELLSFTKDLPRLQLLLPQYWQLFQRLSKTFQCYICAGTIFVEEIGKYRNRAYLFSPNGSIAFQDKLVLTPEERTQPLLTQGTELKIFHTSLGTLGIAICYDCEFSTIVHQQIAQGAELILVPSLTTTRHGYFRVHLSCRARAVEHQCYVAQSSVVGQAPWLDIPETSGGGGIFSPCDTGFPEDGILALAEPNIATSVSALLSFSKLQQVRKKGQVHNYIDGQTLQPYPCSHITL